MYTMNFFSVVVILFRCFSYCFSKCLVSFVSNLGVILQLFWSFRTDYRALGCHWATLRSQHGSRVDPGSILRWLWKPLGHPSGSLCGPFGRPKDPRTEKNDAPEGVCSQARFLIGFSSLFKCLGPVKTRIPCGRGMQNHIFDRDRKKHDFKQI